MPVCLVIGVPGVGKSTIMDVLKAKYPDKIKIVIYGDYMVDIAREEGLVRHRDEMRKLPTDVQKDLQERAADRIYRESLSFGGVVLVDTHGFIKTPNGFFPGLPERILKLLNPSFTVLIEADPEEIASRRAKDETRERDVELEDLIRLHQELNRMAAVTYATLTGCNVVIIRNEEGKIEKSAKELAKNIGVA